MELLDASMDKISKRVSALGQTIPENIIGKMTVAVIKALHYLKTELRIIHRGEGKVLLLWQPLLCLCHCLSLLRCQTIQYSCQQTL